MSVRKYPSAKSSHDIETSQSIYNVNRTSGFCMMGALSRKAFPKKSIGQ